MHTGVCNLLSGYTLQQLGKLFVSYITQLLSYDWKKLEVWKVAYIISCLRYGLSKLYFCTILNLGCENLSFGMRRTASWWILNGHSVHFCNKCNDTSRVFAISQWDNIDNFQTLKEIRCRWRFLTLLIGRSATDSSWRQLCFGSGFRTGASLRFECSELSVFCYKIIRFNRMFIFVILMLNYIYRPYSIQGVSNQLNKLHANYLM